MSVPSSPAPCYQPDKLFQQKLKLSNRAIVDVLSSADDSNTLRRVSSVPNTTNHFKPAVTANSTASSSISSSSSTTTTTTTATTKSADSLPQPPKKTHSSPAAASLPRLSSGTIKSSYSLEKHNVQVGPTDFEKVRLLGKGDVGKVYLVKHKVTEKLYALKGEL